MTREENIKWLESLKAEIGKAEHRTLWHYAEAIDMAIESLQEPKTIIGIDIPYGSDKGIAALFKGKDDKLILEEVKEIMEVVRCKDCAHQNECEEVVLFDINDDEVMGHRVHWCSYGRSEK